jgi:pyridoxal phosphate-dependent aminotransferase EpsN
MGKSERQLVDEAFDSNWIAPLGPQVDAFEREVSEYVGSRGALALNSGTAAVHLALRLLGVGSGDAVFCSSLTFIGSTNPILYLGAEPVFIDSEPETWNMSPRALEKALMEAKKLGRLPKAVIVVDIYGQSADFTSLQAICDEYRVPILEDAAEALGAAYRNRRCGTHGKFGVFSFNGNKIITTSGGGMIVSDDLEALNKARFWSTQARDPAVHYQHTEMGYNYRLSNILAAIGRGQLRVLDERVTARRAIFDRYHQQLYGTAGIDFMPEPDSGRSNRWLTVITVDPARCGKTSFDLLNALEEQNIESRPVWKPMHRQPLFENCRYYPHGSGMSVSDKLFEQGLCLPSGANLSDEELERVIGVIRRTLRP